MAQVRIETYDNADKVMLRSKGEYLKDTPAATLNREAVAGSVVSKGRRDEVALLSKSISSSTNFTGKPSLLQCGPTRPNRLLACARRVNRLTEISVDDDWRSRSGGARSFCECQSF